MPIYEQTYRRYEAREALRQIRFWPITREGLRLILVRRAFLGLLILAWLPFLVQLVRVYVVTRFPEAGRILPVDGRLFGEFLNGQVGLAILVSVFGGAGLVANDLRTGGILVYLSRPLTRRDYVLGKLGVLLALNLAVTLVPAVLLYLAAIALAPDSFLKWELAWLGPAILLQALVICLVLSLLVLAISALSRSARVAGLAFVGLIMGLEVVRLVVRAIYKWSYTALFSIQTDLKILGNALFGITDPRLAIAPWVPAVVLLLVGIGCLFVLRQRVRAVEIVR